MKGNQINYSLPSDILCYLKTNREAYDHRDLVYAFGSLFQDEETAIPN